MLYKEKEKIIGYHGTATENVKSIIENNFFESLEHEIWLGDGVYFFVEGISSNHPIEYAKQFAVDSCYSKIHKKYTKKEYSVVEALIKINNDKFLDLTDDKGNKLFNDYRDMTIAKLEATGKVSVGGYKDSDVFKIMRESLGIEFVKSNLYIKFAIQRLKKMSSVIPNVTVIVVNNPVKNIQKPTIKEVFKGLIL